MKPNWAEENLQTIRTLMERSALYRRALAPIMIFAGIVGIVGGLAGWRLKLDDQRQFIALWIGVAMVVLVGALLLIRRQALKDSELFWSPPTRRVAQALAPSFFIGAFVAAFIAVRAVEDVRFETIVFWCWLFGFAVHAAGFFMPRGMKYFGWAFISAGCLLAFTTISDRTFEWLAWRPHLLMAAIFGGLHLAYGIYLYFTEKKNPAV
jgi:hypothetical protein